jgi:hypothetical protein
MQFTIDELLALQRADGGWSQIAEWKSDLCATSPAPTRCSKRVPTGILSDPAPTSEALADNVIRLGYGGP